MEPAAALNTITTQITIETAITTIMTDTKLAITAGTTDSCNKQTTVLEYGRGSQRVSAFFWAGHRLTETIYPSPVLLAFY
jgi:hypothetical protein